MKKTVRQFCVIAALVLMHMGLGAQSYFPVAVENATWIITYGVDHYTAFHHYAYKLEGDTVFQSMEYKKVYHYDLGWNTEPPYQIQSRRMVAFIRDDTLEKKVYGVILEEQIDFDVCMYSPPQEVLLYDFDILLGDTLRDCLTEVHGVYALVEAISSEQIYAAERQVWSIGGDRSLIEGVGNNLGLFWLSSNVVHAAYGPVELDYCIGTNFECGLHTRILSIDDLEHAWVFPNPAHDELRITSDLRFHSAEILDVHGRSLHVTGISASQAIDVSALSLGLYFVKLESTDGEVVSARFFKL